MVRLLARPNFIKVSIPLAIGLFLGVVDQTWGQSSSMDASLCNSLAGWGMDSLYHMERGVRGATSCATSSCHGGPKAGVSSAGAPRGSEYPIWFERDPHAQSWKTISSEASAKILTTLGILNDGKIMNLAGYQNCLACHNTDPNLGTDQLSPRIAEGVGCESCHGPSRSWYDQHYQGPESTKKARRSLGLTDSRPLVQRAKICATCHVGGKDRDMNHDIIAAGHPALYFDMAVYHEAYPKHWRDPEQDSVDFRAQLWLAGQIASADSELELLESRAGKSLSVSTWPELAVYQCNSCHITLNGIPKPGQSSDRKLVASGRAPVRNWNLSGFATLSQTSASDEGEVMVSLKQLQSMLTVANPNSERVAAETKKIRVQLYESLLERGTLSLPEWSRQKQMELTIYRLEDAMLTKSWETAAGAYTAAWATHPRLAQVKLEPPMKTMRFGLLFRNGTMSPSFPRLETEAKPPTSSEWHDSLLQLMSALKNEVR